MAVDYDPVKAHEYYIKHRKLKGRHSTKGMSQTQKEQWDYAKGQLSEQHKTIKKNITDATNMYKKDLSEKAKDMIATLRSQIKNMTKEQKAIARERVQKMIGDIRSKLKIDKANLTENAKNLREIENNAYEDRKNKAYEKIKNG